jgi:HD-GYP domain-containing protein (c-di-GMP phosphodiesterase class II)
VFCARSCREPESRGDWGRMSGDQQRDTPSGTLQLTPIAGLAATGGSSVDLDPTVAGKLAALQTLGAKLIYLQDDQLLCEEMVAAARRIIGCDSCALFAIGSDRVRLQLRAADGMNEELARIIPLDEQGGAAAHAFLEEYLIHVPDNRDLPEGVRMHPALRSELAIPVLSRRGPVGLVHFGSRQPHAFADQDVQLSSMLADQVASSLENNLLLRDLTATRDAVIHGMALLAESRDGQIGGHLQRICAGSAHLAGLLLQTPEGSEGVDEEFVQTIARSAALHDIGKVGIPDTILLKPARLTTSEFEVMKTHSTIGGDLLKELMSSHGSFFMLRMGAEVAYGHHERWDGRGYPRGRRGRQIPLSARIVSICDYYDALTSKRIYKDAVGHDVVCEQIRQAAGSHFDPSLVQLFLSEAAAFTHIARRYAD